MRRAIAVLLSITFVSWCLGRVAVSAQEKMEEYAYFPSATQMMAMRKNLEKFGENVAPGTHTPIHTLTAGNPQEIGVAAYFFKSPFDGVDMWIFEEVAERYITNGKIDLHIVYWRFYFNMITRHEGSLLNGDYLSATEFITTSHLRWSEAVQKSHLAWKLLCEKFGCP